MLIKFTTYFNYNYDNGCQNKWSLKANLGKMFIYYPERRLTAFMSGDNDR